MSFSGHKAGHIIGIWEVADHHCPCHHHRHHHQHRHHHPQVLQQRSGSDIPSRASKEILKLYYPFIFCVLFLFQYNRILNVTPQKNQFGKLMGYSAYNYNSSENMGSTKEREFKGTLPGKVMPALHVYNVLFLLHNSTTSGSYYIFTPRK